MMIERKTLHLPASKKPKTNKPASAKVIADALKKFDTRPDLQEIEIEVHSDNYKTRVRLVRK